MSHFVNSKRISRLIVLALAAGSFNGLARAQLLGEPPIPPKEKKQKRKAASGLEWMWQYSPPPAEGRENELIQDPNFHHFLDEYFTAPQSFWGPQNGDPRNPQRKSLADTVYDFLTIPNKVVADDNRYITVTGAVFHFRTSRGLLFADLDSPHPLVVFAAIDWIRDSKTTSDPGAEYTLWIFPNQAPGPSQAPTHLPPPLLRSLTRWMTEPLPGSGVVQKITAAVLVDPDGTPHQIPVPGSAADPAKPSLPSNEGPQLPKRQ